MNRHYLRTILACSAVLLARSEGHAQLLPSLGGTPGQVMGVVLGSPGNPGAAAPVIDRPNDVSGMTMADTASLIDLRRARLRGLIHDNRRVLDADRDGNPVRRGELIAIDPSADTIARARAAGFSVLHDEQIEGLAMHVVTFAASAPDDTREGLARLKRSAPEGQFVYNHVFEPAGTYLLALSGSVTPASVPAGQGAIGMIDGGVSANPALRNASIEQRGFAPHGVRPSGHGTAVASLMVGSDGRFEGAARGVPLLVADVYGGDASEGSTVAITRALGWLISRGARVINVSLAGPANPLLERAVTIAQARGVLIVAAVGNDGPAAPPSFPASYPGVIAVTGVDAHNHALPEAGKALHLDFAAPGSEMAAALPGSGYATVRGTSFAAPLVTSRLMAAGGGITAIETVSREAVQGRGRVGRGIVCGSCRISLRDVGVKR